MAAVHPGSGHGPPDRWCSELRSGWCNDLNKKSLDNAPAGSIERPCRTFPPPRLLACQQVVSSDPTCSLASHHGALSGHLFKQG
jgi:hypothetical protein